VLDTPLEYKKGESVTNLEFFQPDDFTRTLKIEEDQIRYMCQRITDIGPDVVVSEKGVCDLAMGILYEADITVIRRIKKSDGIRLAKATGATVMNRLEDIRKEHLGKAGIFECIKMNGDSYCKIGECNHARAVTVVLRGPSRDILNELERNLMDALKVGKNVLIDGRIVPGGGGSEMNMCREMKSICYANDIERDVFQSVGRALEVIPSIIGSNSGVSDVLSVLRNLRKVQDDGGVWYGVDGISGEIQDMRKIVGEPISVKIQMIKSAFDTVIQLLRVDCVIETKSNK
jgi:T-complex protein 1 subunit gamma